MKSKITKVFRWFEIESTDITNIYKIRPNSISVPEKYSHNAGIHSLNMIIREIHLFSLIK